MKASSDSFLITEEIQTFLWMLRQEGFDIGVDTAIKAERLVRNIVFSSNGFSDPINLGTLLAPILCKSALEQERFQILYQAWSESREKPDYEQADSENSLRRNASVIDRMGTKIIEETERKYRGWHWGLFSAFFIVAVIIFMVFQSNLDSSSLSVFFNSSNRDQINLLQNMIHRTVLALLVYTLPIGFLWIRNRQIRILQRQFTTRAPQSQAVTLKTAVQQFFSMASAEKSIQRMRKHSVVGGYFLDVGQSIRSVLRSGDFFQVVYRDRQVLPEYLLLVDRCSDEDHLRGVADLLERRLRGVDASVVRYEFYQNPRTLQRWNFFSGKTEETVSVKELSSRYGERRLIIITDATIFENSFSRRKSQLLGDFIPWEYRAILTPRHRLSWGGLERMLEEDGFVVAEANTGGLRVVADGFLAGSRGQEAVSMSLPDFSNTVDYPSLLEEDSSRWLEDKAPNRETIQTLLSELRGFLGQECFLWCCSCAAFPKLHPELTLHLGASLGDGEGRSWGSEKGFLAMSRLPWFRHGFMPDWLRIALLSELSQTQRNNVGKALTEVLMTAKAGEYSGLVLNISDRTSRIVAEFIERSKSSDYAYNPVREDIFLSILRGRSLPLLAVIAPKKLVIAIARRIDFFQVALWGFSTLLAAAVWWINPWSDFQAESALSWALPLISILLFIFPVLKVRKEFGVIGFTAWLSLSGVLILLISFYFNKQNISLFGYDYLKTGIMFGFLSMTGGGFFLTWVRKGTLVAAISELYRSLSKPMASNEIFTGTWKAAFFSSPGPASVRKTLSLSLKGFCMGSADVIPGVSGGTIAFITGIYEDLIAALRSFDIEMVRKILNFDIKGALAEVHIRFLLSLFAGIILAILSMAQLLNYLLHNHPVPIWSLFFGLIVASILMVGKQVTDWAGGAGICFIGGILAAVIFVNLIPVKTPEALWFIFLCGIVAICAMILPGISGAFILLILGKYEFITATLRNPFLLQNIIVILVFCVGCALGLAVFSRVLNYLLEKYHNLTLAFLTGLITGSLMKIWPWKEVIEIQVIRGKEHVIWGSLIMPDTFGGEFYLAIVLMLVGFFSILAIEGLKEP